MSIPAGERLEILELLYSADNAATRRDAQTYASLFSEDAVLDGEKGNHQGRDQILAAVDKVWSSEGKATLHLTLNPVIDERHEGSTAVSATSTLLIIDVGPPPTLLTAAGIVQLVVKTSAGWRIARRTVGSPLG
jgi:ketosteroid isomerase-like protein